MTQQLRLVLAALAATLLTSGALFSTFQDGSWVPPTLLAVLAVTLCSEGARRLGLPRPVVPLVGVVGLAVALTVAFARTEAWYGVVPNIGVVKALTELVRAGFEDIQTYAAPVFPQEGMRLLTAGGIGLVALAVDHLAVTLRRPALAGLPLLAVYSIPSGVTIVGVNWFAFSLGAAGYLGLLLADSRDRLTRWGRALPSVSSRDSLSPLAAAGRRVGVAAVGVAVLLPVAVPGLHEGIFSGSGTGFGSGSGGSSLVRVGNPIIKLGEDLNRPNPVPVLAYRSDASRPGYLREASLDDLTGSTWEPTKLRVPKSQTVEDGVATAVGLDRRTQRRTVRTQIQIGDYESEWLVLPYPVQRVDDVGGEWLWDGPTGNVFSTDSSTRDQDYTVSSLEVLPSSEQLDGAVPDREGFERFLALPEDIPASIIETAQTVTAQAETPFAKAVALQTYLRAFDYDTRAPNENGLDAIAQFLVDRRGFCIHSSSAMAVMARILNIPARVTVGFLPGVQTRETGLWQVSTDDKHAWPELFFPGVGWTTFEPTPPLRTGVAPAYTRAGNGELVPGTTASAAPSASGAGAVPDAAERREAQLNAPGVAIAPRGGVVGVVQRIPWTVSVLIVLLVVAAITPLISRQLVRRRRWSRARTSTALARAAWAEVLDLAVDHGVQHDESRTHRAFAQDLVAERRLPMRSATALGRLVRAAERAEYARDTGDVGDLRGDVASVRAGLRSVSSRRRRFRARWMPASTASLLHSAGDRTADALDGLDRFAAGVRARLLPRRRTNP